jgi:hypothetical protein
MLGAATVTCVAAAGGGGCVAHASARAIDNNDAVSSDDGRWRVQLDMKAPGAGAPDKQCKEAWELATPRRHGGLRFPGFTVNPDESRMHPA